MLRRLLVAFGVVFVAGGILAVFFLGGAAVSGGRLLVYPPGAAASADQYARDEDFLMDYLGRQEFQKRPGEAPPPDLSGRRAPEGFTLAAALEHPIPRTRPFYVWLYRDSKRSGFWLFSEARHPTWAVPYVKAALKKLRDPLGEAWENHLGKE